MAKTIITLGREYCTGGRYIAKDVARALGIKLYDKELITMAAKNSGLSEEAVAASEKRHTHSLSQEKARICRSGNAQDCVKSKQSAAHAEG